MNQETQGDHVRVFAAATPDELERKINEELKGGDYSVTSVSLSALDHQNLYALVSFRIVE